MFSQPPLQPSDDTEVFRQLREGRTLFGSGWRCVDNFEEVDDDLEDDDEEEYVVMDLGTAMDSRTLQTEATYQLIGMDTPMPFLKIGEHVFQGTVSPLIGDEVILDVVRQEDDPQRPHHRPAYKTRNRVELRAVHLMRRDAPAPTTTAQGSPPKLDPSAVRSFFPQRNRRKWKTAGAGGGGDEDEEMDVDSDDEAPAASTSTTASPVPATPTPAAAPRPSGLRHSFAPDTTDTDDGGASFFQPEPEPETPAEPSASGVPETPTPALGAHPSVALGTVRSKGHGRPRGSTSRASLPVSTLTDLEDIHHAGGLGDVRLEIADDATPELLAAVSAIRGKPSGPGTKLSRAQEERLVRGLPASGPGSRGGRGGRGRGAGTPRRGGRPRGRSSMVNPAGVGLAEGFLGIVGDEEWEEDEAGPSGSASGQGAAAQAGPSLPPTSPLRRVDSDEELREIGDEHPEDAGAGPSGGAA